MRRLAGSLSTRSPQSMFALSSLRRAQSTDAPPPATTFSQQHLLRRLPVPPLRQTLDTYLRSLVPLLQDRAPDRRKEGEDERAWVERELARRRRWADEFEVGVGRVWQERLIGAWIRALRSALYIAALSCLERA